MKYMVVYNPTSGRVVSTEQLTAIDVGRVSIDETHPCVVVDAANKKHAEVIGENIIRAYITKAK